MVGGPFGFPDAIRELSKESWSLASGVYPSDFAWLMLWEQLYRSSAINNGISYHHA
jgi:23S rRNA (pseudouridine1915-N3)-methyltransferase